MGEDAKRPPAGTGGRSTWQGADPSARDRVSAARDPEPDPSQPTLVDVLEDGRRARDQGAAAADHAASFVWRAAVDDAIARLAATGEPFTAEGVRAALTPGDRGVADAHPNALGARFLAAVNRGVIEGHGYTTASRKAAHGRTLRVWRGVRHG